MEELYSLLNEEVRRVSRREAAKWHGSIDADDIKQELWLWILERPSTQLFLRHAEPGQIVAALTSRAVDICSKERLNYEHFTGQYEYTPSEVRALLDTYWSTDVSRVSSRVLAMAMDELSETMIENILGGTISVDEKLDLEQALSDMETEHPAYLEELIRYHARGEKDSSKASEHARYRAENKLTTLMNRGRAQRAMDRKEGPGTRPKNTTEQEEV